MPNKENEVGFTSSQYPGEGEPRDAVYSEELLIGYRWYNYNQVKPAFPFGHGLSYTTFVYTAFTIQNSISSGSLNNAEQMTVTFNLANSGKVDGAEVVQLYLTYPESAGEPPLQLKSFTKVYLPSGQQSTPVTMTLSPRSLAVWDESSRSWTVPKGTFVLSLGASSADIRFTSSVQVV